MGKGMAIGNGDGLEVVDGFGVLGFFEFLLSFPFPLPLMLKFGFLVSMGKEGLTAGNDEGLEAVDGFGVLGVFECLLLFLFLLLPRTLTVGF